MILSCDGWSDLNSQPATGLGIAVSSEFKTFHFGGKHLETWDIKKEVRYQDVLKGGETFCLQGSLLNSGSKQLNDFRKSLK